MCYLASFRRGLYTESYPSEPAYRAGRASDPPRVGGATTVQIEVIYCGDNLEALPKYVPDESVDLIHIDPPFNTSRQYEVFWGEAQERRAFADRYGDAMSYLDWMRPRICELYRVLKPTGSFYYHCDPHASHYVKVALDQVFGFSNFRNEIVWKRTNVHSDSKRWSDVSDRLLYYVKVVRSGFTWNPQWLALSDYSGSRER